MRPKQAYKNNITTSNLKSKVNPQKTYYMPMISNACYHCSNVMCWVSKHITLLQ